MSDIRQRLSKEQNKLKQKRDMNEDKNINDEIERLQQMDDDTFGNKESKKSEQTSKKHKEIRKNQEENDDEMKSVDNEQQNNESDESMKKHKEMELHKIQSSKNGDGPSVYVDKLKEGLLMHQTLKTAENGVVKTKKALSNEAELEKAHKKQMMVDPFGGAFGGQLSLPSNNPYDINGFGHSFSLMPPPPPMPYQSFSDMLQNMQRMNPLQLPNIPGLRGQYASRRRRRMRGFDDELIEAVIKCFDDEMYTICVGYQWKKDLVFLDVYSANDYTDRNESGLVYYFVYDFHFVFDGNESDEQCQKYNEMDVICVENSEEFVMLRIDDRNGKKQMFDYHIDDEWNEIYKGDYDKKCVDLGMSKVCVIEEDVNTYTVELKFAMNELLKEW